MLGLGKKVPGRRDFLFVSSGFQRGHQSSTLGSRRASVRQYFLC